MPLIAEVFTPLSYNYITYIIYLKIFEVEKYSVLFDFSLHGKFWFQKNCETGTTVDF